MPKTYIVTEYGIPHVAQELKTYNPNRLAVIETSWSHCKAFDGISRYELQPRNVPSFSVWQRFLARTIYNPSVAVQEDWKVAGECSLAEIVLEVEKGLEEDNDIIQQWFGADEVLKLLRSATNFEEMVDRVRCICGEFETDSRLRTVVDDVLRAGNIS